MIFSHGCESVVDGNQLRGCSDDQTCIAGWPGPGIIVLRFSASDLFSRFLALYKFVCMSVCMYAWQT